MLPTLLPNGRWQGTFEITLNCLQREEELTLMLPSVDLPHFRTQAQDLRRMINHRHMKRGWLPHGPREAPVKYAKRSGSRATTDVQYSKLLIRKSRKRRVQLIQKKLHFSEIHRHIVGQIAGSQLRILEISPSCPRPSACE